MSIKPFLELVMVQMNQIAAIAQH